MKMKIPSGSVNKYKNNMFTDTNFLFDIASLFGFSPITTRTFTTDEIVFQL